MAHAGRVITAALAQNYRRAPTLQREIPTRQFIPLLYDVTQQICIIIIRRRLASAHVMLFLGLCTFDWRRQFKLLARISLLILGNFKFKGVFFNQAAYRQIAAPSDAILTTNTKS
jgi:hypothetical protein